MTRSFVFFLVTVFLLLGGRSAFAAEMLTNDTIITMVKGGLGEELIISKIKISHGQYDVSTNGILNLKKEGVGDRIIQAMLDTSAPPDIPVGSVVQGQSLFVRTGDKTLEVLPLVAERSHTVKKHFNPFYFGPGDNWYFIRGQKSAVRVPNGKPLFYTRVNPSSFLLTPLFCDPKRNIRYFVSTPGKHRDTIPVVVNRLSDDLFELSPGRDLVAGEYAFISGGTFYGFGIE